MAPKQRSIRFVRLYLRTFLSVEWFDESTGELSSSRTQIAQQQIAVFNQSGRVQRAHHVLVFAGERRGGDQRLGRLRGSKRGAYAAAAALAAATRRFRRSRSEAVDECECGPVMTCCDGRDRVSETTRRNGRDPEVSNRQTPGPKKLVETSALY